MKMNRRLWIMALFAVLLVGAVAVNAFFFKNTPAFAQAVDDEGVKETADTNEGPDVPITGAALEQASAAALEYLGEGRVTGTEVGDEEGYYEVEVTLENGRQVDVHLDEAFKILSQEND